MDRVLFIASKPFFPWRGPCIRASHDLLALGQLGYAVDFLTVPIGAHQPIPGVCILKVPNIFLARSLPEGPSLRKFGFDLLLLIWGLALVWSNRYTVVHGLDDAGVVAWIVGRAGRAAVVFEKQADASRWHGVAWRRALGRMYARVENLIIGRVDAAISAGPQFAPAMSGCGGRACRIPDIPASLDPPPEAHIAECRRRMCGHVDDILVTYVGSFATFQGLDLLYDAMAQVHRADERTHLIVVGGSAREIARQERALARQKLGGLVTFLGRVTPTDLAAVLTASDILAVPRLGGAYAPMKVLDYLQSGTAIVATDCTANRDILTSDVALLTLPAAGAFAAGILTLCRDPVRRHALGRSGRDLIASAYRFDQFQDDLRRCYTYVISTRGT